jgi:hypothetical protein
MHLRNYQKRSSPLFSKKNRIEQIEEILFQMAREDRERWERNDEENRKLRRSLNELIGYNQNVDSNLEVSMGFSFKNYLVNTLKIPESCILECDEHEFCNPKNGDIAVEWDGVFIIDYSKLSHENGTFIQPSTWPPHNTVYLLEVKQLLNVTSVLIKIPDRISKTITSLTSTDVSKKRRISAKTQLQRSRFPKDPRFVVVVGGSNVRGKVEKEILHSGYLAIRPTGDDFKVVQSRKYPVKVFNATAADLE